MVTKHILVISYSQTGQLDSLVENFLLPLRMHSNIEIEQCQIKPQQDYPFPWKFMHFFNKLHQTEHIKPPPNKPIPPIRKKYNFLNRYILNQPLSNQ